MPDSEQQHAGGRLAVTSRPVLDPEMICRLRGLGDAAGEDLLEQLTSMFLADAVGRVAAMHQSLAQGDAAAVARSAHLLSGASANLGAVELARLSAAFETECAALGSTDGKEAIEAIVAELGRVQLALLAATPS